LIVCSFAVTAQVDNPYHLNGNAYQENCNCYTLTPDAFNQSGSVWNINKINLNEPFDYNFNLFLGCNDGDGADGIAFVLQPISTSIGAVGGGIGYDGVNPSIGVLIDTWQNFEDNDPVEDHIAIHKNGFIDHSVMTDVTAPMPALASGGNIEDCQWHTLRVSWNPVTQLLNTEVDGQQRVSATINLVRDVFSGDPMVFWGFTSATGGAKNHQRVCTSLNPGFSLPAGQLTCFPQTLQFIDSSTSFGSIDKWFWDFGDGTLSELPTPPPHTYAEPGVYNVQLKILGSNGCLSEVYQKEIVMGTKPVPAFSYSPAPVCEGYPISFRDESYVEFGTINKWNWTIGTETFSEQHPPPMEMTGTSGISLSVETKEGCVSAVGTSSVTAYPVPTTSFQTNDICIGEPAVFTAASTNNSVPVKQWLWSFGDGMISTTGSVRQEHRYASGGNYEVQLTGYSEQGCPSFPAVQPLKVYETNAYAGNDTVIAMNEPLMLNGTGGEFYRWTPASGLSADDIPNPVATLTRHSSFVLTAYTSAGCETTDTINIKVYKGPAFYVPNAFSPNNDGRNDQFRFIAVGLRKVELFQVYNRYGQLLYSSADTNSGWNGQFNGQPQPSGTYVWVVKGLDAAGTSFFKKGTVTLVR